MQNSGTLVKAFTDTTGVSISGSPSAQEIVTSPVMNSSAALRIVTAAGANTEVRLANLSYDFHNRTVGWWVYIVDHTKVSNLLAYAGTLNYATFGARTYDTTGAGIFARNGWHFVSWGAGQWSTDIGESLEDIKLRITPVSGQQAEVIFDSVYINHRAQPRIVFLFDDGHDSHYTYRSIMDDRGISAGYGYIRDQIGAANRMTAVELQAMYDNGHDMVVHGDTEYTTFTRSGLLAELRAAQDDLLSRGFSRGKDFIIYPNGTLNRDVIDVVKGCARAARSTDRPTTSAYGYGLSVLAQGQDPGFALPIIGKASGDSLAQIQGQMETAVKTGIDVFTMFHEIVPSGATGIQINEADLEAIADTAVNFQNKGLLTIVSPSEYMNGVSRSPR